MIDTTVFLFMVGQLIFNAIVIGAVLIMMQHIEVTKKLADLVGQISDILNKLISK